MPELPEVETITRQLRPLVRGRQLQSIQIIDEKLRHLPAKRIKNRLIDDVFRLGKQIIFSLASSPQKQPTLWLGVHLRMTGRLIFFAAPSQKPLAHTRACLKFTDGSALLFQDTRRFGLLTITDQQAELEPRGIDPLSSMFTLKMLGQLLKNGRQEIKSWLLRQDRLVGLGNIYASEILFAARLNPRRLAASLSDEEIRQLYRSTRRILQNAIKHGGTTFSDYQDASGQSGGHQHHLAVYGQDGKPCSHCGELVVRLVQGGRSTFYCPGCQI